MALVIVSAKNSKEAKGKIVNNKDKKAFIVEDKGLQEFFFGYRDRFKHYNSYYKLEPYGLSKVDAYGVVLIKEFAESVMEFIENNKDLENESIETFNVSFPKVKRYIDQLINLAQYALRNNDHFIELGD